jgi:amino acid permease
MMQSEEVTSVQREGSDDDGMLYRNMGIVDSPRSDVSTYSDDGLGGSGGSGSGGGSGRRRSSHHDAGGLGLRLDHVDSINDDFLHRSLTSLVDSLSAPFSFVGEKFHPGGLKTSIFNLSAAMLGAGALALPWAIAQCGLALGLVLLVGSSVAASVSMSMLAHSAIAVSVRSYDALLTTAVSARAAVVCRLVVILYCFGTVCGYLLVAKHALPCIWRSYLCDRVCPQAAPHDAAAAPLVMWDDALPSVAAAGVPVVCTYTCDAQRASSFLTRVVTDNRLWLIACASLGALPLSMFRSPTPLRFVAFFSFFSMIFFGVVIFARYVSFGQRVEEVDGPIVTARMGYSFFAALPCFVFAFGGHWMVLPVFSELERPSATRGDKIIHRSQITCFFYYAAVCCFGYLSFRGTVVPNVLRNYKDYADPLLLAAKVCVTLSMLIGVALNVIGARGMLMSMFGTSGAADADNGDFVIGGADGVIDGDAGGGDSLTTALTRASASTSPSTEPATTKTKSTNAPVPSSSKASLNGGATAQDSLWLRIVLTVTIVSLGTVVPYFVDNLSVIFGFSGAVCGSLLSFVFPGYVAMQLAESRRTTAYIRGVFFVCLGSFVMITGVAYILLHAFHVI